MSTPSVASLSARLTTTSSLLLERARVLSLGLKPSAASSAQIFRGLASLRADLARLDDEARLEQGGLSVGAGAKGKGKGGAGEDEDARARRELGERYDRLVEMLADDEVGREKAKTLRREARVPSRSPSPARDDDAAAPSLPQLSVVPPTPGVDTQSVRPFRDDDDDDEDSDTIRAAPARDTPRYTDDDADEPDEHDVLAQQQLMMDDQDDRLNLLSHSIHRQSHLSVQIGSELDLHHELLEDTDAAMDRTADRLGRARRRLDRVADDARQYGSTITIVVLIVILLLLIIVFKT